MVTKTTRKLNRKTEPSDLRKQRDLRMRNRVIIILTLPVTIFLWLIGWLISSPVSSRSETQETRESVRVLGIAIEEERPELPRCYAQPG